MDGRYGMMQQHVRARVTHDHANTFAHVRSITMGGTVRTEGFLRSIAALLDSHMSELVKFGALLAQRTLRRSVLIMTINADHLRDDLAFVRFTILHP